MTRADALLPERPDSALAVLQKLSKRRLTAKERARYALLTTIAQDKCYSNTQDDSLASFAYRYYSLHGDKRNLMKASYYLGCIYQNSGEIIEAVILLKEAEELAKQQQEYRFLGFIELHLADICATNYDHRSALQYAESAYSLFMNSGEELAAAYVKTTSARQLYALHEFSKAEAIVDSLLAIPSIDPGVQYYSLLLKAEINYVRKDYGKAGNYYSQVLDMYPDSPSILGYLAITEEMIHHPVMADSLLEKARQLAQSRIDSTYVYVGEQQIQYHRGNYQQAYDALVKTSAAQDRVVSEMLARSVSNAQLSYYEEGYLREKAEKRNLTLSFSLLVIILIFIIALISIALYERRKQIVQEMDKVKGLSADLQKVSDRQHGTGLLMSSLVRDKISTIQSLTDAFFSWSDEAIVLREQRHGSFSKEALISQFRRELRALRDDKSLFTSLEEALNLSHNNVLLRLRQLFSGNDDRSLKELDYQLLTLMFSGFSHKSISFIADMSEESIRTRKFRYKKMFLAMGEAGAEFVELLS